MENDIPNEKLAVLIDVENISHTYIDNIFSKIATFGTAIIKRAYGDWSAAGKINSEEWQKISITHGIKAEQNFKVATAKNSSDMACVIEAMDLLHTAKLDGFCIVSSDSDFTLLARRIRESGLKVYGFGEQKTSESLQKACDEFIFVENLNKDFTNSPHLGKVEQDKLHKLFQHAFQSLSPDDEEVYLGELGAYLKKIDPSFDARNYGYSGLKKLIEVLPFLELVELPKKSKGTAKAYNVKLKYKTLKK